MGLFFEIQRQRMQLCIAPSPYPWVLHRFKMSLFPRQVTEPLPERQQRLLNQIVGIVIAAAETPCLAMQPFSPFLLRLYLVSHRFASYGNVYIRRGRIPASSSSLLGQ
jgi:hypothetical protein